MITETTSQASSHSSGNNPASATGQPAPSPALLFDTITAYQKTAAIKAGIELDVFSALAEKPATADAIAAHCRASSRGIRILCDYLTLLGFLTKSGDRYALTQDSAIFLNRKSPAYAGGVLEFMLSDDLRGMFDQLTDSARAGGTAAESPVGTMAPDHPVWLSFARAMGSLMAPAAAGLAELIKLDRNHPTRVLDISASHGTWGFAFARKNPQAHLVALDWAPVLEITKKNAQTAGIASRFSTIAGSAFDVDLGHDYDVVLIPNFLHHFSPAECIRFLKRAHAALRPGGSVAIVEFVPNPDRVTPPMAAGFSLVMLATTADGDAYTFAEFADMLAQAGFNPPTQHTLPASMNVAVIATK
jgi:ubiquinone/menaquinone biosynthesis C-methylase UbiE